MNEELVSDDVQSNDSVVDNSNETIPEDAPKALRRMLAQRKADQEKLRVLQEKLKELEPIAKDAKKRETEIMEQKLMAEGNLKAILDSRDSAIKDLEVQNSKLLEINKGYESKFTDALKINAFKEAIGGSLKKNEYYGFVDTSKIALDPETGAIDDTSLKLYANDFVGQFKELINFKSVVKLPNEAGDHSAGGLSYEDWVKLAQTNPSEAKKRMKDVKQK